MGSVMAARLSALLPRLAILTVIWLLATSTITFAAGGRNEDTTPAPVAGPTEPAYMVVPDVREQAYVFAKGILADAGYAWRVEGPVKGYAANTVVSQEPAPGTKLEDTGAPTIVLRLAKNPGYTEKGLPENRSGVDGTAVVLAGAPVEETPAPAPEPAAEPPAEEAPAEEPPAEEPAPTEDKKADKKADDKAREPDFVVPGAPAEPTDELPLPARATLLSKRMNAAAKPTPKLVNYWLYQHSWIVTGASFGWSGGDDALPHADPHRRGTCRSDSVSAGRAPRQRARPSPTSSDARPPDAQGHRPGARAARVHDDRAPDGDDHHGHRRHGPDRALRLRRPRRARAEPALRGAAGRPRGRRPHAPRGALREQRHLHERGQHHRRPAGPLPDRRRRRGHERRLHDPARLVGPLQAEARLDHGRRLPDERRRLRLRGVDRRHARQAPARLQGQPAAVAELEELAPADGRRAAQHDPRRPFP